MKFGDRSPLYPKFLPIVYLIVTRFTALFRCEPADPGMFPCIRNEWFKRQGYRTDCGGNYDDINTITLTTDLRIFLRHHTPLHLQLIYVSFYVIMRFRLGAFRKNICNAHR